jgi:hypothetical protein
MKKIKYKLIVAGLVALLAELFGPAFGLAASPNSAQIAPVTANAQTVAPVGWVNSR